MQNSKFNFAWVVSIIALLVFSYITFLGLIYWKQGNLVVPILLTLSLLAVVVLCVFLMCEGKATRFVVRGNVTQFLFGIMVLFALLLAAFPFTNFLRVVNLSDEISDKVRNACKAAIQLDEAYNDYVQNRINNYRNSLKVVAKGKSINPTQYAECLGGASGATDDAKIDNLCSSLKNKLLPESTAKIIQERHTWLICRIS